MSERTVNIVGVGYIGSLIAIHLADKGYEVIAVDRDSGVLDRDKWFNRYSDIREEIDEQSLERIKTTDSYDDIEGDTTIVCVNTPSGEKSADLSNIRSASRSLGEVIESEHRVIIRSTIPPGTTGSEILPMIEEGSGLEYGEDLHLCYAPEFIRGGTGLNELRDPSKTVIAGDEEGKDAFDRLMPVSDNRHEVELEVAEAVKYFDNAFHGLKISLANECGRIGVETGFDPSRVMDIISSDYRLNVSDMYMRPGNAYGGPCLRKDIDVLSDESDETETETPVISSINESNREHNSWLTEKIKDREPEKIAIIGATYKEGFNSAVNSPGLEVASELEENDQDVIVYEPSIDIDGFHQAELSELNEADLWIIFNQRDEVESARNGFDGDIIDLCDFSF